MASNGKLELSYEDDSSMNQLVDQILDRFPDLPQKVQKFSLIPSSDAEKPELAIGEDTIIRICIEFGDLDDELRQDIEEIIGIATRGAKQILVESDLAFGHQKPELDAD